MDETVEIPVKIMKESPKAFFVETPTARGQMTQCWIPKSQILDADEYGEGEECDIQISEWIADQKGLG